LLAAALVIAGIVVAGVYGARQVYFLGIDEGGRIALYRGLPYELPFDVRLYTEVYSVGVQASSLPEDRRGSVVDHELRSRDDAVSLLDDLEAAAEPPLPQPPQRPPGGGRQGGDAGPGERENADQAAGSGGTRGNDAPPQGAQGNAN
jgi:hypothetical protein